MDWKKMQLKRHALTGISYMIPVVVAGGGCGPCCADCQKTVYRGRVSGSQDRNPPWLVLYYRGCVPLCGIRPCKDHYFLYGRFCCLRGPGRILWMLDAHTTWRGICHSILQQTPYVHTGIHNRVSGNCPAADCHETKNCF